MEKLLLIDGLNMLRRIYGANPAPDSQEKATGSVKATVNSLRRALSDHRPTHVLALFDSPEPNWRHTLYAAYREGRAPMPEPLRAALPELFSRFVDEGVPVESAVGYEADDALNGYSVKWCIETAGADCVVLSTDKDIAVLALRPGVRVYNHFTREWHDESWSMRKFGIPLSQLSDYLALVGDATDGIPGVTKVGAKTAAKLLTEHGTLDEVLEAAANIPGALGKRLQGEAHLARLSRSLVELRAEGPGLVNKDWSDLRFCAQRS